MGIDYVSVLNRDLDTAETLIKEIEKRCDKRYGQLNEWNEHLWCAYRTLLLELMSPGRL